MSSRDSHSLIQNDYSMNSSKAVRVLIGLVFLSIGITMFLRVTGFELPFQVPPYVFSWKMILVVLGIFFIVSDLNRSTGIILVVIGGVFLARDLFDFSVRDLLTYAIPVIFLLAGFFLLFPHLLGKKKYRRQGMVSDTGESLEAVHIFSSGSRMVKSETFRGGELVSIFASANVYFRDTKMVPGSNVLHVTCIFGGSEIHVPDDWLVRTECTTLFSDLSDKRFNKAEQEQTDEEKVLIIKGFLLFAGLEIKSP